MTEHKPEQASSLRSSKDHKEQANDKSQSHAEDDQKQTKKDKSLTDAEYEAVEENGRLSALTIYTIILREGQDEMERPVASLWWSGLAAGICISSSVLAKAIIRTNMGADHPYLSAVESLGYTIGFILVIMSRLQLFTENTITVVLPLLVHTTRRHFMCTARLWGVVLGANLVGTFITAAITVHGGIITEDVMAAVFDISRHLASLTPSETLLRGIPAGFFIAAIVWMLPSAKSASILVIILFTWLISAGSFTHVIAGSNEVFSLVLNGEMTIITALIYHIGPMLIGNIIGGTGLFAMLAYGQIHQET
jgi:formate/nitrite transporter FocA (FNT family)